MNQMNKSDERDALAGEEAFEERRRDVTLLEIRVAEDTFVQRDGRLDAFDHEFVEARRMRAMDSCRSRPWVMILAIMES